MQPSSSVLEQLFENAPHFVEQLAGQTADSYEELIDRAEWMAADLPEEERIELLNGHPRIGAVPSGVSATSFREQGYGHDPGTAQLQERLDRLNAQYEQRFGFRFVVFVAGRPRSEVADVMEDRLQSPREAELRRGLADVFSIARDRLSKLQPAQQEAR
jgi:2-oxo-4-hydroxy-4-carboxy--5-ureidoimidazoline (OHCU) decarboxylase